MYGRAINLFTTSAQVKRILGQPQRVENSQNQAIGKVRTFKYRDIIVDLVEATRKPGSYFVFKIVTQSPKYRTLDGVRVGDNQAEVTKTYGQPSITKNGEQTILSYQGDAEKSPSTLVFKMEKGKVTEITCLEILN